MAEILPWKFLFGEELEEINSKVSFRSNNVIIFYVFKKFNWIFLLTKLNILNPSILVTSQTTWPPNSGVGWDEKANLHTSQFRPSRVTSVDSLVCVLFWIFFYAHTNLRKHTHAHNSPTPFPHSQCFLFFRS